VKRVLFAALFLTACAGVNKQTKSDGISDGPLEISSTATAPIPSEVENDTQAHALSRDAAVSLAQTNLLTYVLQKKTRSKKTLAEAEVPSLETQESVRGVVKGARIVRTKWTETDCVVTVVISKSDLKDILKKN
jgi:hypothetical protein